MRALEAIHRRGFTIPLVLTRPDRPSGRGLATRASDVKAYAVEHGLAVAQPATLRAGEAIDGIRAAGLDVLVVAAYGLILPRPVLELPRHGCLNIHASLLPRWRGAAPIARAIDAGDETSGITIMQMDAGLDTGPIVVAQPLAIGARETAGSLHDRLAAQGAAMIVDVLERLAGHGRLDTTPQPAAGATYAAKIDAADARVDWHGDAVTIDRRIRALSPAPGAVALWRGKPLKLRAALPLARDVQGEPGVVLRVDAEGIDVACGRGVLRIVEVQPAGGRPMRGDAFARGHRVAAGERLAPAG